MISYECNIFMALQNSRKPHGIKLLRQSRKQVKKNPLTDAANELAPKDPNKSTK